MRAKYGKTTALNSSVLQGGVQGHVFFGLTDVAHLEQLV
jgi:hypothetical protein